MDHPIQALADLISTRFPEEDERRLGEDVITTAIRLLGEYADLVHEPHHLVNFTETSWTLQHPLECRRSGSLFECATNVLLMGDILGDGGVDLPPEGFGLYAVQINDGVAIFTPRFEVPVDVASID